MFKKVLAGSLMLLVSQMTMADILPYAGVDAGYTEGNWKLKDPTGVNYNYGDTGLMGGVFAGVGGPVGCHIYLGLEGFYDASSVNTPSRTINLEGGGTTSTKLNIKYSYGLGFTPGFLFSPQAMAFLRLGFIESRFNTNQSVLPAGFTSNSANNMVFGEQAGVGLQSFVTQNVFLRIEYDYVWYRTFTAFNNKVTGRDNQFRLGLGYQFS